jgi:peptide/nickel transport system permease protein
MAQYILRRVLLMIPMLVLVSMFVFVLIQLPPGSYIDSYVMQLATHGQDVTADVVESLREQYGFNEPIYVQYWKWVSGWPRGDFGPSYLYFGEPTLNIILYYLGYTVLLAFGAQAITLFLGLVIGIYSATHQYSLGDHFFTLLGFLGLSIPSFLLALVVMYVAYAVFGVTSIGGLFSDQYIDAPWSLGKFVDLLQHLWLPILLLGITGTAGIIRRMRGNLLDVLNMPYVNTARAKGLGEGAVIYKHALRNALAPIIMAVGMWFPHLLSGSVIVAIVLSLPTLGPVMVRALQMQDMYLAGTVLFFQCVLLLVGNLIADIALAWVDPRVEFE